MKTLVSVITGRKDYPVFDTDSREAILEYVGNYNECDVHFDEEGLIVTAVNLYKIIDVEVINLN